MAATWIKPIHASNGKTNAEAIRDTLDYVQDPEKTQNGYMVGAYQCNSLTADLEFADSKHEYFLNTGRKPEGDILVYHVRQSFKPGEISTEAAQEMGRLLAMELTGGNHAFVVATHDNTAHVHNHIIINAVNLECNGKYRNKMWSHKNLAKISDRICAAHRLSVIDERGFGTGKYKQKEEREPSHRDIFVAYIDEALAKMPRDFDEFLQRLAEAGCKIKKRGKTVSVQPPSGAKRFFRFRTGKNGLPEGCDEESLREKISAMWVGIDVNSLPEVRPLEAETEAEAHAPTVENSSPVMPILEVAPAPEAKNISAPVQLPPAEKIPEVAPPTPPQSQLNIVLGEKIKSIIDIGNSAKAQNSRGYEMWAKSFNLQQAAQTLLFLQENNIADVDALEQITSHARNELNALNSRIDAADTRLKEISALQKNIGTYRKTRDIYSQYLRTKRNKDFYAKNKNTIQSCEAAKQFFDTLGLEKIPTYKELQEEYASLVAEKQKGILQRTQLKKEFTDLESAQKNVCAILDLRTNETEARQVTHEVR
ncbi:MAG: relaxase/mobilization nuclease domain-containing protein [Defluviitaleaceae bacterium]|nr:relaxase/mobilization nuclease domain-containing protein [Defluviitaleaceae bacterium]